MLFVSFCKISNFYSKYVAASRLCTWERIEHLVCALSLFVSDNISSDEEEKKFNILLIALDKILRNKLYIQHETCMAKSSYDSRFYRLDIKIHQVEQVLEQKNDELLTLKSKTTLAKQQVDDVVNCTDALLGHLVRTTDNIDVEFAELLKQAQNEVGKTGVK